MFEISQLRCFDAVAEELNFGRAARRLNMTQPPLSRQIQMLEREVGTLLLERSSRAVRLTPAGRVFLPEARRILQLSESAIRWTQRVWRGEAGTLRIGFTAATAYGVLPELLKRLSAGMPGVDTVLREMVSGVQMDQLMHDGIDIGLMRPPVDRTAFATRRLSAEPLMLAVSRGHRLAKAKTATVADLSGEALIGYSPESARYFHDLLQGLLSKAQVSANIVQQLGQVHSMLSLVDAGFGLAVVPASAACLQFPHLTFVPLTTQPENPVELTLVWRRENDNPALAAAIAMIADETASGL